MEIQHIIKGFFLKIGVSKVNYSIINDDVTTG